jgi:Uma2 family endonuclease
VVWWQDLRPLGRLGIVSLRGENDDVDRIDRKHFFAPVYADLGVQEVWIYNGESLVIQQLQNGTYITSPTSQFFLNIPIPEIAGFLQQAETVDYLELVQAFRNWVRSQIR